MKGASLGLVLCGLAACGVDLTPGSEWLQWDAIEPPLRPELGVPSRMPASDADRLRVVTYNVAGGARVDDLARALREDPDLAPASLLLLQEAESYPDEGTSRAARLADELGLGYAYIPARPKGDGTLGLAILSAYPIDALSVMVLPDAGVPLTGTIRIAAQADILVGGRPLRIVDLHLDTSLNIRERMIELRPAVIDQPDPIILGGDFNTNDFVWAGDAVPLTPLASAIDTSQAPMIDELMARLGYDTPTADLGPTESHLGVESRLDSIYLRGLAAGGGAVVRDIDLSDHWPVWIDVAAP